MSLSVTIHGIQTVAGVHVNGRWATADITTTAGEDNIVYTVPFNIDYAMASISICNRAETAAIGIAIAIADEDTPTASEFIEWSTTLVPRGVLERTQLVLSPSQRIIIRVGQPGPTLLYTQDFPASNDWRTQTVFGPPDGLEDTETNPGLTAALQSAQAGDIFRVTLLDSVQGTNPFYGTEYDFTYAGTTRVVFSGNTYELVESLPAVPNYTEISNFQLLRP